MAQKEPNPPLILRPLSFQEERELSTGRDTANFIWKCGFCKRESSAKFDKFDSKSTIKPYDISSSEKQEFSPIVVIECRGLEFTDFDPRVSIFMMTLIFSLVPRLTLEPAYEGDLEMRRR